MDSLVSISFVKWEEKYQMDIKYGICGKSDESIYHMFSFPVLAFSIYLHARHNQLGWILYQEVLKNECSEFNPPEIAMKDQLEVWWDQEAITARKVLHKRLYLLIWSKQ